MDVLRKELNAVYARQHLEEEALPPEELRRAIHEAGILASTLHACAVITDVSCDRSWLFPQLWGRSVGLACEGDCHELSSSDEDAIYTRMHPEDLVDKRMFELAFFTYTERLGHAERLECKAACRIRIKDGEGKYIPVDNTTQLLRLSPAGRIWLVLCTYRFAENAGEIHGIDARVIDNRTGEIRPIALSDGRNAILSQREKEILRCIRAGRLSKEIAAALGISIHTVNRHRQNILHKLSVGNSMEAVNAAMSMRLL